MRNPVQVAEKLARLGEIRSLLMDGPLNTQQITDTTGMNVNTLRHYLINLGDVGHITCERVAIRKGLSMNIYSLTAAGMRAPNPASPRAAVDNGCHRDCLVAAFFGARNVAA